MHVPISAGGTKEGVDWWGKIPWEWHHGEARRGEPSYSNPPTHTPIHITGTTAHVLSDHSGNTTVLLDAKKTTATIIPTTPKVLGILFAPQGLGTLEPINCQVDDCILRQRDKTTDPARTPGRGFSPMLKSPKGQKRKRGPSCGGGGGAHHWVLSPKTGRVQKGRGLTKDEHKAHPNAPKGS